MRIDMHWEDGPRGLALYLAPGARMVRAAPIPLEIRLVGSDIAKTVAFNGAPLSIKL